MCSLSAARFEYWLMGEHVHINTEMKVIYYPDSKAQLTRDDIIMIFGEPEAVDRCIEFAASLQRLKLTYEEVAVLKAIIITFRGKIQQQKAIYPGLFFGHELYSPSHGCRGFCLVLNLPY